MNYDKLELDPKLYEIGLYNKFFNKAEFWRWYLYATIAGIICYIVTSNVLSSSIGFLDFDLWAIGTAIYLGIVFMVNFKILIDTNTHNFLSVFLFFFSTCSFLIIVYFLSEFKGMHIAGVFNVIMYNGTAVLTLIFIMLANILVEYGWRSTQGILHEWVVKGIEIITTSLVEAKSTIVIDGKLDSETMNEAQTSDSNTIMNKKGRCNYF